MEEFYSEVLCRIRRKPRGENNNLNLVALEQKKREGLEVHYFLMRNTNIGAAVQNPLWKLYNKGALRRRELNAGLRYQTAFEIAHLSRHSRPSYDGTSISSTRTKRVENTPTDNQISAHTLVNAVKMKTIWRITEKNKKLLQILNLIFEKQVSIHKAETILKLDYRIIERGVREICQVMLEALEDKERCSR